MVGVDGRVFVFILAADSRDFNILCVYFLHLNITVTADYIHLLSLGGTNAMLDVLCCYIEFLKATITLLVVNSNALRAAKILFLKFVFFNAYSCRKATLYGCKGLLNLNLSLFNIDFC